MKVRIEIDDGLPEEEVVIRCRQMDETVRGIQEAVCGISQASRCITLKGKETTYYNIPLREILFFETDGAKVQAHTRDQILTADFKLYELEESLPGYFMRISKSTIVNLKAIYSITRNLTASSLVTFADSHKRVYVSRNYYKALVERLEEKRIRS